MKAEMLLRAEMAACSQTQRAIRVTREPLGAPRGGSSVAKQQLYAYGGRWWQRKWGCCWQRWRWKERREDGAYTCYTAWIQAASRDSRRSPRLFYKRESSPAAV